MVQTFLLIKGTSPSPTRWLPQAAAAALSLQGGGKACRCRQDSSLGSPCNRTEEEHLGAPESVHMWRRKDWAIGSKEKENWKSNILNAYLEIRNVFPFYKVYFLNVLGTLGWK